MSNFEFTEMHHLQYVKPHMCKHLTIFTTFKNYKHHINICCQHFSTILQIISKNCIFRWKHSSHKMRTYDQGTGCCWRLSFNSLQRWCIWKVLSERLTRNILNVRSSHQKSCTPHNSIWPVGLRSSGVLRWELGFIKLCSLFSTSCCLFPFPFLFTLFISSLKPLKQTWSSHQHLIHQPGPPWPAGEELGVRATVVSVFCSQEAGAVKVWVVCACVRVEYEAHTHFCSLTSTNHPIFL